MDSRLKEHLPGALTILNGGAVFLISFLVKLRFSMPKEIAKPIGFGFIVVGMSLVIWAAAYVKEAFLGEVEPELNVIVKNGPYRFVRHPVYLGMTIAILGVPIALRSWPGLIAALLLFLPTEIYRAKLEEKALLRKFGKEWEKYAAQTGFFLPFIGIKKQLR